MKSALCWLLFGLVSGSAGSQTFSERTDVVVVEVPVQVIGADGEPVRGLTAENFAVLEGRKKQSLVGFEVLDLAARPAGGAPAPLPPIAARRHFLLMFDFTFSLPKSILQAREAAQVFVEQLHPSDLVSVGSYTPDKGSEVLLQFTSDRPQILAAVDRLGLHAFRPEDRVRDPLGLIVIDDLFSIVGKGDPTNSQTVGGAGSSGGRKELNRGEMEEVIGMELGRTAQFTRERSVANMARSYGELANMMAGVRGRKYVVLFSEGFDNSLLTGTANVDDQNEMAEAMRNRFWNIDSTNRFGSTKTVSHIEEMLEEFRRADCVIQAVDIAGLRAGAVGHAQWSGTKDSLFLMAKETGGELFENHNDLGLAVAKVLKRTSVTYVLAFQPEVERDGSYHRLNVELKGGPKGARLVHRPGYYAPRPYGRQSPLEKALVAGQAIISGVSGGSGDKADMGTIRTSVLAAAFPAGGETAYVPVLIEADGAELQAGAQGGNLPVDIYAYAFDEQGRVRDFFSQSVGLDLAKIGDVLQRNGLKFFGHLDLPPGEWSVRVLVRNGATGAMGLKVATVHVPEFTRNEPVLLPPLFPEPQGKWLIVREAPREGDRPVSYPFMAGEEPFIPASQPVLAAGAPAKLNLVGYHLKPGELRAEARVLTSDGREAGVGEIAGLQRLPVAADGSDRWEGSFAAPPGLKPGEYMLLVTLTDSAGASETSVTPFVIAPRPDAGQGEERS